MMDRDETIRCLVGHALNDHDLVDSTLNGKIGERILANLKKGGFLFGQRRRLPFRRQSECINFDHGGTQFFGTVGYYDDGTAGEIFLQGGKAGSGLEAMARDAAVFASLALQYGCPIDVIRAAITRLDKRDGSGAAGAAGALFDSPLLNATETANEASGPSGERNDPDSGNA